ncbi:MAG: sel1 repeat family protein [Burkholderiales bacterium]|nr:sel1 repeat family protein [Burkholderiales bacterium]
MGTARRPGRARRAAALACLWLAAAVPPAAADAEKGRAALEKGDYKTALVELNRDAKAGDAGAMFILGQLYAEGKGVKADHKVAFQWMERAARLDHALAQSSLAMFYSEGIGTARDDAKSLEWGRKAADAGVLTAQFIMGVRYNNGVGVARDAAEAVRWWTRAAERGFIRAQVALASVLSQRAGAGAASPEQASADRVEAAKWLIVAGAERLPGAEKMLPELKAKMTEAEVEAAEKQAGEWRPPVAPQ